MRSVAIYCGSSDKIGGEFLSAAREIGRRVAHRGLQLVYGAGKTGLMGAVADGALEVGGEVIGIMPEIFDTPQLAHQGLTRYEVVPDIPTRKGRMAELADGYIALPGGFGTFEELFEMLTWSQIGLHHKPVGLLNAEGYFNTLIQFLMEVEQKGFTYKVHNQLFHSDADPDKLLDWMMAYTRPAGLEKWVERDVD